MIHCGKINVLLLGGGVGMGWLGLVEVGRGYLHENTMHRVLFYF